LFSRRGIRFAVTEDKGILYLVFFDDFRQSLQRTFPDDAVRELSEVMLSAGTEKAVVLHK
jgi:hypothetical protein